MKTRSFEQSDLAFLETRSHMLWLELQYNQDYDPANALTVTDDDGEILGIAALSFHCTWYADAAQVHKLVLDYQLAEESPELLSLLITESAKLAAALQLKHPEKKVRLISFQIMNNLPKIQKLLHCGFCFGETIPVLAYDLTGPIRHYPLPEGISIQKVGTEEAELIEYNQATGLANNGICDSLPEYRFRSFDPGFLSFRAVSDGRTVGGISIWDMGENGATENIFTIPEFRRRNIARELIAAGIEELKRRGKKTATLSMLGGNASAMRLYQSIGYTLSFYLTELVYPL